MFYNKVLMHVTIFMLIVSSTYTITNSGLLQTSLCDFEQFDNIQRKWDAKWMFPEHSDIVSISYNYREGQASVSLVLRRLTLLTQEESNRFIPFTENDQEYWSYHSEPQAPLSDEQAEKGSYTIFERRRRIDEEPSYLSVEQAANLIKNKRVVVYTGAGISAAAGVLTMVPLMKALSVGNDISSIQRILSHQEQYLETFSLFCNTAYEAPSTVAHDALALWIKNMPEQIALITENFDIVHERSGVMPYRIDADALRSEDVSLLRTIDVLLCIGMSHDDKGFIGWYKHHNPEGVLIALDLKKPLYVGQGDFLIQGDLQDTVPELVKMLLENQIN